ncbi:MAG: hypothetical protein E6G36_05670 [Actinobacteria bacterium]|nr:MAG: hypothetical protein E6G36_05670 [Actinomycetota bacterium]
MRDRLRQRVAHARADRARDGLDVQRIAPRRQPHRARAARNRKRRLEHPPLQVEPVRRQLGDAVRHDRARKVDRLPAGADEREPGDRQVGHDLLPTA